MNGELARTTGTSLASGQATSVVAPMSEFMIWNDMAVTPSRLRPPLEAVRSVDTPTRSDDD